MKRFKKVKFNNDSWIDEHRESVNLHVEFGRKIIVLVGHRNLNMLLDNNELQELKILFSRRSANYLSLLTHFNYKLINN
jgi:hypothetical protein